MFDRETERRQERNGEDGLLESPAEDNDGRSKKTNQKGQRYHRRVAHIRAIIPNKIPESQFAISATGEETLSVAGLWILEGPSTEPWARQCRQGALLAGLCGRCVEG